MWIDFIKMFILAQTEQEKKITYVGLALLALFLFVLFLDSIAKGKVIPTKGPMKTIVIFMLVVVLLAIILVHFVYK